MEQKEKEQGSNITVEFVTELMNDPYSKVSSCNDLDIELIFCLFFKDENNDKEINDLIKNAFDVSIEKNLQVLSFLINEYFINNNGSNYKNVYNMIFIILLNICEKSILNDIISPDDILKIKNLFNIHNEYIKMFILSAKYYKLKLDSNIHNHTEKINNIISELKKKSLPIILPFAYFDHSMTYVFKYDMDNKNYRVVFINSGKGSNYHHNTIINNKIYTKAIYEYDLNEDIFKLFLISILINNYTKAEDFYNSVIFLLESNSKQYPNNLIIDLKANDEIDKYYYNPQLTGDCTMRSFILPLYYYSKVLSKSFNNFFTELLLLLRVVLFFKLGKFDFDIDSSNIYFIFTYAYFSLKQYIKNINIIDIFDIIKLNTQIDELYLKQLKNNNNKYSGFGSIKDKKFFD